MHNILKGHNAELVQPKMSLNNRDLLSGKREGRGEREREREGERERERERERETGMWAGQQVGIFKVKLGLGEIER